MYVHDTRVLIGKGALDGDVQERQELLFQCLPPLPPTRRADSTTTRHRDADTLAAKRGHRARAVCRRRVRSHDSSSGIDGITIQRDCERHHDGLRNWSCEHKRSAVLPARDWVQRTQLHVSSGEPRIAQNTETTMKKRRNNARCRITSKPAMPMPRPPSIYIPPWAGGVALHPGGRGGRSNTETRVSLCP